MKTVISLPGDLFASTDALARRLGVSRSALVAAALSEFVAKHRVSNLSERLHAVYGAGESGLDPATRTAQAKVILRSEW
jgi:metal-responsive CopG/Arc/MetJ family transcriptional regulator